MLHNLKYLLSTLLVLSFIFVGCLVCYVSANTQLVNYEKSENSLFNFNNTYYKTFNELTAEAKLYISTGDSAAKYKITNTANNFMSCNSINTNYIRFSDDDELNGFESLNDYDRNSPGVQSPFSLDYVEQDLFLSYLSCSSKLIDTILSAVDQKNISLLYDSEFINLTAKRDDICTDYTAHYLARIFTKKANLENFIKNLSILLVAVGSLLILCAGQTILLYQKRNRYNAYFNQLYSKAIENSNIGMAIVDRHYKYEYMNTTYKQILNIQAINPLGQTSFAILPEEIATALPSHNFSKNQNDIILSYTHEGETLYVKYNCFPIFDGNDEPKFVSLIQDYTESNQKDMALKQQLKTIEFFANAKSSFIANVSHEIKTPLNVIIGMVHIFKQTVLTEKQTDVISKVHTSSGLLLNIINDVLDISKIQKSTFVLYPSDFNFSEMLNESEEIFAPIIHNKGLEYIKDFNFSHDLCLSADKTRLTQVLLNLINNACKFTNDGHIRLTIEQITEKKSNVLLKFTIEDTGLGIDAEDVSKVFQEFEQLENDLTKQHQGTGLGLAICKHVVNAMGGDIWIESEKSIGSKFYFTIWARTIEPAQCALSNSLENEVPLLNGEGHRILVVEDTELNYEVTENLLSESKISCEHACNGQEAIDMCIRVPEGYYTAILMDIHMPIMDGYTASEILKTEIGITCPIIALTATSLDLDTKEKYKGIIDDFVSKPFRYNDFHRALLPYFGSFTSNNLTDSNNSSIPPYLGNLTISEAARSLGCSEKQYIKHLTKFKSSYVRVDIDIQELLMDKNYTEAHRIAHSVKGLAGTLGLLSLQEVAADLEVALKQESDKAASILAIFRNELHNICQNENSTGEQPVA